MTALLVALGFVLVAAVCARLAWRALVIDTVKLVVVYPGGRK